MKNRAQLYLVTFMTAGRFPLVMLFFLLALWNAVVPREWVFWSALGALILSAVTDLFDGYLARKYEVTTKFGAHADPLMDKFFYLTSLPLVVFIAEKNSHTNHAIVLLILTVCFLVRDQWVTFLRSIGSMYNESGGASWIGKFRTAFNFPLICFIYFAEDAPVDALLRPLVSGYRLYFFEGIGFAVTVLSIYSYTKRYWPFLRRAVSE